MTRRRTPEKPSKEALFREIPDTSVSVAVTGAGTVDTVDLSSVSGESLLDRWVFVTPQGGNVYLRRYGATAPLTASMQAGKLWADGVTQEFYIDGALTNTNLAIEGDAACNLIVEFGSAT